MVVRVFLTGTNGFVGTAILDALLLEHPSWTYVASDLQAESSWQRRAKNVEFMRLDIRDRDQVRIAIASARPDVIVHSAGLVPQGIARYTQDRRDEVLETNVGGTRNLIAAAKAGSVSAFVFTGSCTVITDDLDHEYPHMTEDLPYPAKLLLYGESKAMAEQLVLAANSSELRTCSLRPSSIFGPGDYQLIPTIHACIAAGQTPFLLGTGDNLYDFTYVDNVALAHVLAVQNLLLPEPESTAAGQAIFISNGAPITFRDFCLAVWAQYGHVPAFTVPISSVVESLMGWSTEWIVGLAWLTGRKMKTSLCRGSVKDAVATRYACIDKARRVLGYEPKVEPWDGLRMSCRPDARISQTPLVL